MRPATLLPAMKEKLLVPDVENHGVAMFTDVPMHQRDLDEVAPQGAFRSKKVTATDPRKRLRCSV